MESKSFQSWLQHTLANSKTIARVFWLCLYIPLISSTIVIVVNLWDRLSLHPTVTTMVSSTYPVNKMPFPGVSICSINKISRHRAQGLAEKIANATRKDPKQIMTYMRFIGQLYDFDFEPTSVTQLLEFQNILDDLQMNVIEITKNMATPCEELLKKCFWRGVTVNCSKIFRMRLTHRGHCCAFNYVKITEELTNRTMDTRPITTDFGVENGLQVWINNNLSDYFYTTLSSPGAMISIFVPTDYPDQASGGMTEIITEPNSENFIEIVPTGVSSVKDVGYYSVEKRDCLMDHERRLHDFEGIYSQSDCNLICRVKSIEAMCQCIPFTIPFSNSTTVCTLADIPCLNRYKNKWHSYYPLDDVRLYLPKEKQESLRCDTKCYSPCAETVYETSINSFPIFNQTEVEGNLTLVYVYYLHRDSKLYRQDVVYYWFEVLSNFGGIAGIFIGWSVISVIQFFLHYGRKAVEKFILFILVTDFDE